MRYRIIGSEEADSTQGLIPDDLEAVTIGKRLGPSGIEDITMLFPRVESMSVEETLDHIANLSEGLRGFWTQAEGWAPVEAAQLLSRSRIDWQVSLARCLRLWVKSPPPESESGSLILGWANLGALVEGTMKLYLSVWYADYKEDLDAIRRKGDLVDPDDLQLEMLRQYFNKRKLWTETWDAWVLRIQQRRNAIHAYKDREIGSLAELIGDVRQYLRFLRYINGRLPYPDFEVYAPRE